MAVTVVTFRDAEGREFPITLIGSYATMADAIEDANGALTKARWEGKINPTMPVTIDSDRLPYEWGDVAVRS